MQNITLPALLGVGALVTATSVATAQGAVANIDSNVNSLLRLNAVDDFRKGKYESQFFLRLLDLAERQRLNPLHWFGPGRLTDGRAFLLQSNSTSAVIVILATSRTVFSIPGDAIEHAILLDKNGRFLDKVTCNINSRYGMLNTDFRKATDDDASQLIVRFVPWAKANRWHNWHKITIGDKVHSFVVIDDEPTQSQWTTQGLCRIAIRDGKFAVVWPKLGKSDAEVLKEKKGK